MNTIDKVLEVYFQGGDWKGFLKEEVRLMVRCHQCIHRDKIKNSKMLTCGLTGEEVAPNNGCYKGEKEIENTGTGQK